MLASAGSIVLAVAVFTVATVLIVGHQLRASLDTALRQRAQDVAQLAVSAPAVLTEPPVPNATHHLDLEKSDLPSR